MSQKLDVQKLFRLWADPALNRDDIARLLGVGGTTLQHAVHRYKLPLRDVPRARRTQRADPTPEEIRIRAREMRRKHFAEMRRMPCPQ